MLAAIFLGVTLALRLQFGMCRASVHSADRRGESLYVFLSEDNTIY